MFDVPALNNLDVSHKALIGNFGNIDQGLLKLPCLGSDYFLGKKHVEFSCDVRQEAMTINTNIMKHN